MDERSSSLMISHRLRHRDPDWSDLVPGAIAVGLVGAAEISATLWEWTRREGT
jgi:hypothetical protein